MPIAVRKNDKESGERLIQRFSNKMKASRVLLMIKEKSFFRKKMTKRQRRESAIWREYYRAKRERERYYN